MTDIRYPKAAAARVRQDRASVASASSHFAFHADYLPDSADSVADCNQDLWLTVFFDGTGNNEEIDAPTFEHSNIARLFRVRQSNSVSAGRYSFYVPGIGTPFREIGDPGGKLSMAVAGGGEMRLQWAMGQIEAEIKSAEARARNPVNKIRSINIAVFGFSRGAALARAFALRIDEKCRKNLSGVGQLWHGKYPTRLYFMGLFDTVASVGVPSSARKFKAEAAAGPALLGPVLGALPVLVASAADGHMAWASDLRIPEMVERCVHYCAAHEIRNSFPLDTLLEDGRYPRGGRMTEAVYPGVHSNVGGGYRPGEGGRNRDRFAMLSLIPLNAMYGEAVKAGVPLRNIHTAEPRVREDFLPVTKAGMAARALLSDRFNQYMTTVGWGGSKGIGTAVRDHMLMYFRWRIVHVGRKIRAQRQGKQGWEEARLKEYDASLGSERKAKSAALKQRQSALAVEPEGTARYEQLKWGLILQNATVNTMPSDAQTLIAALEKYDQQFLEDSDRVRKADRRKLRPFELLLREAWDQPALTDGKIIAFFDEYVTDSLAGFDSDRTRATEHRWLYQGGDDTVDYAAIEGEPQTAVG